MFIKTLRLLSSWVGCALIGAAVTMSCSNDDLLQNAKESHRVVEDSMTFSVSLKKKHRHVRLSTIIPRVAEPLLYGEILTRYW